MSRKGNRLVNTRVVYRLIMEGIESERSTHAVKDAFQQAARMGGRRLQEKDLEAGVHFIEHYLRQVPAQLEAISSAAKDTPFAEKVRELVEASLAYWREPDDLVPDKLGLLGLMDDGYVTMSLLQSISEECRAQTGQRLLAEDFQEANAVMARFIGSPVIERLDAYVANLLQQPQMSNLLAQLLKFAGQMQGSGYSRPAPDPIWGNASPQEIANVKLGAMGIF